MMARFFLPEMKMTFEFKIKNTEIQLYSVQYQKENMKLGTVAAVENSDTLITPNF
jgi:hypothetical protein